VTTLNKPQFRPEYTNQPSSLALVTINRQHGRPVFILPLNMQLINLSSQSGATALTYKQAKVTASTAFMYACILSQGPFQNIYRAV